MRKRYKRRYGTVIRNLTAVILILSLLAAFVFYKIQPVLLNYAKSEAETLLLNAANEAVLEILDEEGITYRSLVSLSKNSAGYITGIETDIIKINRLKSLISGKLSEIIEKRRFYDIDIPFGAFFSKTYAAGIGPRIRFKMQLTSTARVDFGHEFCSAGINQVLHIVTVDMNVSGGFLMAGFKDSVNIKTSAIAAQTVIVGAVPEAFTEVTDGGDGISGIINDYGATTD